MRRLVSLPPWRCCLATLCASVQPPPGPSPGFSLGYQTKIHLVMTAIRLQISCKWTKRRATWSIVALPPWQCCLPTLSASLQSPPSHWPSLPYDDFISSGLRVLYRSPLRGLPISPALTMFNSPVNPLSRSLSRDSGRGNRYPRLCPRSQDYEGISFAFPGMGTHATSVLMSVRHSAVLQKTLLVKTLQSALESFKFQLRTITAFFIISGDSGQIPLELWPSWRHEEDVFPLSHGASRPDGSEAQSVVRSCLPPGGFICACHFGAARHAAWDVSLS